jgi:diguanylate cyclase (GGDEF)-like protein/PAS domain S-box-containing protein
VASGYWDGKPALIGVSQDISERLHAEERQRLAASVFDNAHEGIMITDQSGRIIEVNSTFTELTGYTREEAIGSTPDLLKSGHHDAAFYLEMWAKIRVDGYWRGEIWNRKKTGEIFVEQLTISTVRNRDGEISHYVAIFSDITLIKQHQQRLEHLAHFDALTQLPNRMLLSDRLQLAKAQSERSGKQLAVCYLDLDNFKPINDEYGHSVGDYLLIDVAQRLKTCVRAGDTVARLGGDEFVLLIGNLEDIRECDHAMARVINALAQPFRISQRQVAISASIGVTLYPSDGADSDTLLRHADQAMYAAKQAGRNRYHLFDPENDRRARAAATNWVASARAGQRRVPPALPAQGRHAQRHGDWCRSADPLAAPGARPVAAGTFLPAIEGSEMAIEIGDWVINETLRQMDAWRASMASNWRSASTSPATICSIPASPGAWAKCWPVSGGFPRLIELEVLETAALEDIATTAALFAECRKLGVSFALDDFGTGYSSLTYFRRLPADLLKIDQSFVRDMLDNPDDLAIVEGVIGLTQAFRRAVIAEGVETVEHGLVLLLLGCDMAQGFGIARPMPPEDLPAWIRNFLPDELWNLAAAFNWSRDDLPLLIAGVDHSAGCAPCTATSMTPRAHRPARARSERLPLLALAEQRRQPALRHHRGLPCHS